MAKLKKQILGKVSGKLGDIVFRNTRKTNYIASRPGSFNTPMDESALTRRGKFAVSGKFASILLSIPELKYLWQPQIPTNKNIINQLISLNYPLVNAQGLTENVSLTPPMGFTVQSESIVVSDEKIEVKTKPLGFRTGINQEVEKSVGAFCIVSLNNPQSENLSSYVFISLTSERIPLNLTEILSFEFPLTNQNSDLMNKYSNRLLLFCLVTFDYNDLPISYSATFYSK